MHDQGLGDQLTKDRNLAATADGSIRSSCDEWNRTTSGASKVGGTAVQMFFYIPGYWYVPLMSAMITFTHKKEGVLLFEEDRRRYSNPPPN